MTRLTLPAAVAARLRDSGRRVVITGASGWLGLVALEMLCGDVGPSGATLIRCFGSSGRELRLRDGTRVQQRPLAELSWLPWQPSILLHFAYLTREKADGMSATDYAEANRSISRITEAAAGQIGVDRVALVSSGAVYQALAAPTFESAHPYGALKLEDEMLFRDFAQAKPQRKVLALRLFNLSGPYINKPYALASFIEHARTSDAIHISADHPVVRSYTGVENLIAVAIAHLLDENAEPWTCLDTAGEIEVEMGQLADLVRMAVNPEAGVHRPPLNATAPADRYVGSGAPYHALAKRHGITLHPLAQQVADTAAYLAESQIR